MAPHERLARGDVEIAWERLSPASVESAETVPILFLHGFGMRREAMRDLARAVSEACGREGHGAPGVGIDLRGHGDTTTPDRDDAHGYPEMLDDVVALLERLAPGGAHLVGHSMGGQVALLTAIARPELVRSLCLIAAGPCRPVTHEKERASWERAAARFEEGPPDRVRAGLAAAAPTRDARLTPDRVYEGADGARLARVVRGGFLRVEGDDEACRRLSVPTLLLVGEDDAGWLEPTLRLAELVPGAELRRTPDAGHLLHLERGADCARAIASWVARIEGGRRAVL